MPDVPQWFKLKNNAHLTTDIKSSNEDQATKAPLLGVKTLNQVKVLTRLWKHREHKNILWFASIECKARKLTEIRVKERSTNLEQNAGSPTFSRSSWQQTEGAILRLLAGWPDPSPKCHCCGVQRCELCLCYLGFQFHPNWSTSPLNITLHSSIVAFIKRFKSFHSVVGGHLNTHNIACTSCFIFLNFIWKALHFFFFLFFLIIIFYYGGLFYS